LAGQLIGCLCYVGECLVLCGCSKWWCSNTTKDTSTKHKKHAFICIFTLCLIVDSVYIGRGVGGGEVVGGGGGQVWGGGRAKKWISGNMIIVGKEGGGGERGGGRWQWHQ